MEDIFYTSAKPNNDNLIIIDDDNFHHITRVMRMVVGNELYLTNGEGIFYKTELVSIGKKSLTTHIISQWQHERPLTKSIHFFCGILKNRDRFEWITEKLGELGITSLTPLKTERTVKQSGQHERLKKIAISALKQSKNAYLLLVKDEITIKEANELFENNSSVYFLHEKKLDRSKSLQELATHQGTSLFILVGPEGGFSDSEISVFLSKGLTPIWLGQQRFRTETAAIVAASFLNQLFIRHD